MKDYGSRLLQNLEDKASSRLSHAPPGYDNDDKDDTEQRSMINSKAPPYQYYVYDGGSSSRAEEAGTPMTNIVRLLNRGYHHQPESHRRSSLGKKQQVYPVYPKRKEKIEHHSPVFNNWRF